MSIISPLATELGKYTDLKHNELVKQLFAAANAYAALRTVFSDAKEGEQVAIPTAHLSEVIQGFQKGFTPKGDLTFDGNIVTQRRHKIDISIEPDDIVNQWHGHLYDENKKREDMPLVKFIMDLLLKKMDEDRELQMVFKGQYVKPTNGTAGATINSVDGLLKIISNAATAGKHSPFALGDFTADQTFEYLENFFSTIPHLHRYGKLQLWMSHDVQLWYARDKRATFAWQQQMEQLFKIDFSNIQFVPTNGLAGTKFIGATPKGNMVRVISNKKSKTNFEALRQDREVKVMGDWHECFGVSSFDHLWTNDQL